MHCSTFLKSVIAWFIFFCFFLTQIQAQAVKEKKIAVLDKMQAGAFPLVAKAKAAPICFDINEAPVVRIAARALKDDIKNITGIAPDLDSANGVQPLNVIIGTIGKSRLIDQLIRNGKLDVSRVQNQWETFSISVMDHPSGSARQSLVIAGSDARGTAFGVFELSKMLGVSPLYWWADVRPEHKNELFITRGSSIIGPPSVKYRGIFINDEDWGLQPWAAKTFEPETNDIGPKTYAKVFELLLRLKANLIWPAMHPSTRAFFHYPGNVDVAADYAIIIGSSHAEPMLRNNVDEWDEKTMGHFNYITNKEKVLQYWDARVKQSTDINAMYSMGMRGVHDSKMEGVKDEKEAVPLLEQIIDDQRALLKRYLNRDVASIPQVFTAYKEVLDIYDAGLKLPEDITLVWPDDNYGYIQRLNNEKEKTRSGGSGVYYHASYWGRPHDYLWLGSMHPALMREEMMKAYANGADKLWVLNVGDIKPLEYSIQQFLDMGYETTPFRDSRYVKQHLDNWVTGIFGREGAAKITELLWQYYQLAFERKPEFMGWSQTEPTTQTGFTDYNHFFYGDEAQKRIDAYEAVEKAAKLLGSKINENRKDAFYELVYYPIAGASWMNKKYLYRDKAFLYAQQNRLSAIDYAALSKAAYDSIVKATEYFNNRLAGGKWKGIMSMKPRDLPVYRAPVLPEININGAEGWSIAPEGFVRKDSSLVNDTGFLALPDFDDVHRQQYFIDVFLTDRRPVSWTTTPAPWIRLSKYKGVLRPEAGKNQDRIRVGIDWEKVPKKDQFPGRIEFKAGEKRMVVTVHARKLNAPGLSGYKGLTENNGFVSIHAAHFSRQSNTKTSQWQVLEGLGYSGKALQVLPSKETLENISTDTNAISNKNAFVEYAFYTFTAAPAVVSIFNQPTQNHNKNYSMRYAVSVDNGPVKLVDFRTFGRTEEWKQNVLGNRAERKLQLPFLGKGAHTLKIFAVDPGVILDEIRIDLGGLKKAYGLIPE